MMSEQKYVLITGGAGFIGSHLSKRFVLEGYKVLVIDNLFRGKQQNIDGLLENGEAELYEYDLTEHDSIAKVEQLLVKCKPAYILHYAAINGTQYFYDMPEKVVETNSIATLYLLKSLESACAKAENYRPLFLFASTSETYCEPFSLPTKESDLTYFRIEQDRDSYAVAKMVSEFYVKLYCEKLGLDWLVLRIFNVYGPNMIGSKYGQVVPEFLSRLRGGEYPLRIFGDGSHTRSFIHIDDHVELTLRLLSSSRLEVNTVYNLGNDIEVSIRLLGEKVMETLGLDPEFELLDERDGDHLRRCPDISKLKAVVGDYRFVSLEDGLKSLADIAE